MNVAVNGGPPLAIPVKIDRRSAISSADCLGRTLIGRLLAGRRRVVSSELVYFPYWCHEFVIAITKGEPSRGRVAIETRSRSTAIVPMDIAFESVPPGSKLLPPGEPSDSEAARRTVWFEALARERRRHEIEVEVGPASALFVPYWVIYLRGQEIDVMPVDATTGKVDLTLREPIVASLLEERTATNQVVP